MDGIVVELRTRFAPLRLPWLVNELVVETEPDGSFVDVFFNTTNAPARFTLPPSTRRLVLTHRFGDEELGKVWLEVPELRDGGGIRIDCRPHHGRWIGRRNPLMSATVALL